MRIVSLVPSLSRTVCDLGLREALVGCTSFCISPPGLHKSAEIVGGTKDPDMARVAALAPTHILVNDEENTPEIIAACHQIAPTTTTAPIKPEDSVRLVRDLGRLLHQVAEGDAVADRIDRSLKQLSSAAGHRLDSARKLRFLYLIWRDPYMVAGRPTYISNCAELLGWVNAYDGDQRYPSLSVEQIRSLDPDIVLFASEPYPFRLRHIQEFARLDGRERMFYKVDGQLFSWWGSMAAELFDELRMFELKLPNRLFKAVDFRNG